ncbi:uncharacterized protein LOC131034833 isoform X1 [Cryptomeria japonica]|uniref:uncharacterized protein LOC131034833 isoform X1 n=1 Tax=Cryptomeria japonica TaxID=3369 RepID=UPI0027D9E4A1|nr:uncharacterized protein LOC131034833 isoform X1 [Cryptomeria japonica]
MNCTLGVQCFTCPCPYFLHPVSSFICLASHDKESELCSKNKMFFSQHRKGHNNTHFLGVRVMVVLLRTGTLKEQGWHSAPERQVTLPIRFLKKLSLADVMNCAHSLLSFTSFYFTGSFTF